MPDPIDSYGHPQTWDHEMGQKSQQCSTMKSVPTDVPCRRDTEGPGEGQ